MHISCATCGSFDRPLGVPAMDEGDEAPKFCTTFCEQTFKKWSSTGSAASLFQFYLNQKYPRSEVSP